MPKKKATFADIGKETDHIDVRLSYKIIELFSEGLYASPNKAIEELVANAFDAGAQHVQVLVSDNLHAQDATIVVIDDGEGMDANGLKQHWLIGASNKRELATLPLGRQQIGKFGIGKLATYVLATRLTHITRSSGSYHSTSMDYGRIDRTKRGDVAPRSGIRIPLRTLSEADAKGDFAIPYWFDDYSRRQLTALSTAINLVRDDRVRDALWCAFSRLIIVKQAGASLAMDLSHSRPHKTFETAPIKPFNKFLDATAHVLKNCIEHDERDRGPPTRVSLGDARKLPIAAGTIDLVLTSPPYLNAIDYMRCSKFSLIWMGYSIGELSGIRTESVGNERGDQKALEDTDIRAIISELKLNPKLSTRNEAILAHYIEDMRRAVREAARVLSSTGKAVYVVGENTVSGTFIPNAKIVSAVAELSGLREDRRRTRELPANRRYLPPPKARGAAEALDGRMRREVILSFSKAA